MEFERSFKSAARRDLGLVLAEQPRTLYETSKALGKPTGSIANLAKRMVQEGVLEASDNPPVRGTTYRLRDEAKPALKASLEQTQPTGRVQSQQHLLLIDGRDDEIALQQILAKPEHAASIAWAADLDGTSRMLIALSPEATAKDVKNLDIALRAAGIASFRREVGELLGADLLRREAVAFLRKAATPRAAVDDDVVRAAEEWIR